MLPRKAKGASDKQHPAIADGVFYVRFCREMDSDNHKRPLLFPCGSCVAFSPKTSGFPTNCYQGLKQLIDAPSARRICNRAPQCSFKSQILSPSSRKEPFDNRMKFVIPPSPHSIQMLPIAPCTSADWTMVFPDLSVNVQSPFA